MWMSKTKKKNCVHTKQLKVAHNSQDESTTQLYYIKKQFSLGIYKFIYSYIQCYEQHYIIWHNYGESLLGFGIYALNFVSSRKIIHKITSFANWWSRICIMITHV